MKVTLMPVADRELSDVWILAMPMLFAGRKMLRIRGRCTMLNAWRRQDLETYLSETYLSFRHPGEVGGFVFGMPPGLRNLSSG